MFGLATKGVSHNSLCVFLCLIYVSNRVLPALFNKYQNFGILTYLFCLNSLQHIWWKADLCRSMAGDTLNPKIHNLFYITLKWTCHRLYKNVLFMSWAYLHVFGVGVYYYKRGVRDKLFVYKWHRTHDILETCLYQTEI